MSRPSVCSVGLSKGFANAMVSFSAFRLSFGKFMALMILLRILFWDLARGAPPARRKVLYVRHWLSSTLCSTVQRSGARRKFTGRPNFVRVVGVEVSKRSNEHALVVEQFAIV